MRDVNKYLDLNYPKEIRNQIFKLDLSNKDLEGALLLEGFDNLRVLNASFNRLYALYWDSPPGIAPNIEEIDMSHNQMGGHHTIKRATLRKINFSFNYIQKFEFNTPILTHIDASSNFLTRLDLQSTKNLVELNCSSNPITSLSLNYSPNIKSFDCFGVNLSKENKAFTPTDNYCTFMAIIIPLGFFLLVFIILTFYYRKKNLERQNNNGERTRLLNNQRQ
jgi:hypothetical protein